MRQVYEEIAQVARTNATTLIRGESGTGKELVASAIHHNSDRALHALVKVNCAALPEPLFESELFGHERGAYTGAHARRRGRFELATQGTLFLDEIGELTPTLQAKLLRVLQSREFERVGGTETLRTDARIIAATNRNLEELVKSGAFREDLYYRLKVVELRMPALRDRPGDIELLANHFVAKYTALFNRPTLDLSAAAVARLVSHSWPGNVRELEHVLEAAIALCPGPHIEVEDLGLESAAPSRTMSFREAKACAVEAFERKFIQQILQAHDGNIAEASRAAKKNRRAFWELMRKHGISSGAPAAHRSSEPVGVAAAALRRTRLG
jgi:Nif-specific regulatory protein